MKPQLNALVGSRVSVVKGPEKTSHETQRESGYRHADREGWPVVDYFEDLDVSAQISPFERPDLAPWLTDDRAHEWDVIIWAKIDRAFRDPGDAIEVARWCERRKKVLVFTDDSIVLNYRDDADPMARMMAEMFLLMGAMFAKWELNRFRQRTKDFRDALLLTDRWSAGNCPDGHMIVDHPSGRGKALALDPNRLPVFKQAAEWFLAGKQSFIGIARAMHEAEFPTYSAYKGFDNPGGWTALQVIRMLTSPSTQGFKARRVNNQDVAILDAQGNPVRVGPPIFDEDTWQELQRVASERKHAPYERVNKTTPMLGIVRCGCGFRGDHRLTKARDKHYRYYGCGNKLNRCKGVTMRADEVETIVEETFLEECGELAVMTRRFVPAVNHTEELERVRMTIIRLRAESDAGLNESEEDHSAYLQRMRSLTARRDVLAALPQQAAHWVYEETGKTYKDAWADSDGPAQRRMLVDAGVTFLLLGKNRWEVQIPHDIRERMQAAAVKGVVAE